MSRPLRAEIRLAALRNNLQCVRKAAPDSKVMAVIKANGYGHGMLRVAAALGDADAFAVASIDEALELHSAGIQKPVVLLEGLFEQAELALAQKINLQPVVHCQEQLHMLDAADASQPLDVWLKLDTGMNRLGFTATQFADAHTRLSNNPAVASVRHMTHFACADDRASPATATQIELFTSTTRDLKAECSLANSAGILGFPECHADWVRPGIMLYGASPFTDASAADTTAEALGLEPVMTLKSKLIAINALEAGQSVGYGAEWQCPQAMRVGVVAVGYGDGYPRHAADTTPVLVNGQRTSVIGRVSMDMITVDLCNIDAHVGDEVVLWGEGLPADEVAAAAETIAYELFCNIAARVPLVEV